MRSKPDYVEADLLLLMLLLWLIHKGLVVVDKSLSEAITVVASPPCLDLVFNWL